LGGSISIKGYRSFKGEKINSKPMFYVEKAKAPAFIVYAKLGAFISVEVYSQYLFSGLYLADNQLGINGSRSPRHHRRLHSRIRSERWQKDPHHLCL
jgi:hypothetical protein